jgi:8-oxo-dGTP pyrophosphatase MutT (NUDIX family)
MKLVVAAVIQRGVRFLICQRPEGKQHGGLWEFPGGKIDNGESLEAAVRRELHEELAVEATHIGPPVFSVRDAKSGFEILFIPTAISGEPVALEHSAILWCPRNAILTYPLAPSDLAFAERIAAGRTISDPA